LTLALDGDEGSASHPGQFTSKEKAPGTHWIGGWVGPRAGLEAVVKKKIPSPLLLLLLLLLLVVVVVVVVEFL
jgi:hypothetical protein